jgi:metallo-beta-lactamase family protein
MDITFYGAVREVTGSLHLVTHGRDRILLDCGLFQGRRQETAAKNRHLPVAPDKITSVVLSHAHIDHSGRIPVLTRQAFTGRVICTRPTMDACSYLLPDSGHIQESDADYLNYKSIRNLLGNPRQDRNGASIPRFQRQELTQMLKKGAHRLNRERIGELMAEYHLDAVEPLYTQQDAEQALGFFDGYPYGFPVTVGRGITCTFYDAGHILGSAVSILQASHQGRTITLAYTGDIGRYGTAILNDPCREFEPQHRHVDLLVMESTYGDRLHEPVQGLPDQLRRILLETHGRGGTLLIPSFAFGRTQELLYALHSLYAGGEVPRLPIYVDSPLATRMTKVYAEHPEVYDPQTHRAFLRQGKNPFDFKQVNFVTAVEDSMALMREDNPHIVIASSGMCEAGRILHHLRYKIHNPKNTILIVGYMAQHTLGRRILELGEAYAADGRRGQAPIVRFLNKTYPLRARVVRLGGFSAHGDRDEMVRFLNNSGLDIQRIALVHGEEDQSLALAEHLRGLGFKVDVPETGQTLTV